MDELTPIKYVLKKDGIHGIKTGRPVSLWVPGLGGF